MTVGGGDRVEVGQQLTEGSVNPHEKLRVEGVLALQQHIGRSSRHAAQQMNRLAPQFCIGIIGKLHERTAQRLGQFVCLIGVIAQDQTALHA